MLYIRKIINLLHLTYMNSSIKHKIVFFYFLMITLICTTSGTYSYYVSYQNIQDEITKLNLTDTNYLANNLSILKKDVKDLSTFICITPSFQNLLTTKPTRTSNTSLDNYFFTNEGATKPLNILLASKDYISSIAVYGKNGVNYYTSSDESHGVNSFKSIESTSIYRQAKAMHGAPLWFNINNQNSIFSQTTKSANIGMCRTIIDTSNYTELGFMIICLNTQKFQSAYFSDAKGKKGCFLLFDNKKSLVLNSKSKYFKSIGLKLSLIKSSMIHNSGSVKININNKLFLMSYSKIKPTNWRIVYLAPLNQLVKNTKPVLGMTFLLLILFALISFVVSILISSVLTSPIKKLLTSMQRVKAGNFKDKIYFKYTDEIGLLGKEYTDMIEYISNLIDKVYILQLKENEAELKALYAQINPHFLYNTLDTIYWKAVKSSDKDVSDMIYALSRLFRLTLNKGNSFMSLKNEKEFIENYLLLQKMRFRDKLSYEITFDNKILNYSIPKLILQPFVENIIVHCLEYSEQPICIKITGTGDDTKILFTIEDNGQGIDNKTLINLNADSFAADKNNEDNSIDNHSGYAVQNIRSRLSLYFGTNYELNIESILNKGTTVKILIPIEMLHY